MCAYAQCLWRPEDSVMESFAIHFLWTLGFARLCSKNFCPLNHLAALASYFILDYHRESGYVLDSWNYSVSFCWIRDFVVCVGPFIMLGLEPRVPQMWGKDYTTKLYFNLICILVVIVGWLLLTNKTRQEKKGKRKNERKRKGSRAFTGCQGGAQGAAATIAALLRWGQKRA